MFPNSQDAIPLLPRPKHETYQKLARKLVTACKSDDPQAIGKWATQWLETLAQKHKLDDPRLPFWLARKTRQVTEYATQQLKAGKHCRLAHAQLVIAQSHDFENWPKFLKHLRGMADKSSRIAGFESAVDAIIAGDTKKLKRLIRQDPKLVHIRSTRTSNATLLHYVSANGVEGYRQKTPPNIVEIAEILLNAGAEVDAEADVYGGGATPLGLTATSVHPFRAGVQNPLMQVLLDHGAQIDRPDAAGNSQVTVLGCLANGRREAAIYLAERGAKLNFESAAGVGRLDLVNSYFTPNGKPRKGTTKKQMVKAFLAACLWGQDEVVEFFLGKRIDPAVHSGDGQTSLHMAGIGGSLSTIKLLLKHKAPLELKNEYGGTVLGQTLWSAGHGGDPKLYTEIIETLIAAGAKLRDRHVPVNEEIDELLRRYGSEPEPSWYWFGEGPSV